MDTHTLTLYLVAGGLSISLCLVLLVFAYLQPGTRMLNSFALGIFLLAAGFTVSGLGAMLPRAMTVVGTNMVLLAAGVVLYSGLVAFCTQCPARPDGLGWAVVALTALPFWYWGLVEPDGQLRSAVFSAVAAATNGRTALLLLRTVRQSSAQHNAPMWALAALFGILTLWMAARGLFWALAPTPPASLRGNNPTAWTAVFGYIVLVSGATACAIWMEVNRLTQSQKNSFRQVDFFSHKLRLLWAIVLILLLGTVSEAGVIYAKSFQAEAVSMIRTAELTTDTFVYHSSQVVSQVDTLLQAVRGFYLQTRSVAATQAFINTLPFDPSTIHNIYLISAQATLLIAHDPAIPGRSFADRDYFLFHQATPDDRLFIGSVESGRVTDKLHFRITRRITLTDGSFGGVVLATVVPESFARYYRQLGHDAQHVATLLGTLDRKLRARVPEPPSWHWQTPVESPLWQALQQSPVGTYRSVSDVDQIRRLFAYKKINDLPLVMVTGFSEADLDARVYARLGWLLGGSFTVVVVVLILAALLTIEIRRRDEQDRFMSMLSHELKTPLSVLRMALGLEGPLSGRTRMHAQQSVQDMDAIIERCLQVGRLQHNRHVSGQQACCVDELLAELQTASTAPQRLRLEVSALPVLHTDTLLLRMVLGNLIDNALKYAAPASQVQLSASSQPHKKQPGMLVTIRNQPGHAGWPDAQKVFQKYYRSPGAHSKTGSGLGLYLVRSAARRLGGWVRYVPDTNTVRFEFWLPL